MNIQLLRPSRLVCCADCCIQGEPSDPLYSDRLLEQLGIYSCIGKQLALMTVRMTLARLIMDFDVSFAPGEDGKDIEENETTQLTITPGDLHLRSKRRTPLTAGS